MLCFFSFDIYCLYVCVQLFALFYPLSVCLLSLSPPIIFPSSPLTLTGTNTRVPPFFSPFCFADYADTILRGRPRLAPPPPAVAVAAVRVMVVVFFLAFCAAAIESFLRPGSGLPLPFPPSMSPVSRQAFLGFLGVFFFFDGFLLLVLSDVQALGGPPPLHHHHLLLLLLSS